MYPSAAINYRIEKGDLYEDFDAAAHLKQVGLRLKFLFGFGVYEGMEVGNGYFLRVLISPGLQ